MKRTRVKISLLVGASAVLITMILMFLFSVLMDSQVKKQAIKAIEETTAIYSDEDIFSDSDSVSIYYANMLEIPYGEAEEDLYTIQEIALINWCQSNEITEITRVILNENTYYLKQEVHHHHGGEEYKMLTYINVTGELALIPKFLLLFAAAGVIFAVLGSIIGYRVGIKLEQNELAQKKFFENTSHELKTPLTSIRGYGEGIAEGVITDYQKTGHVIVSQTEKMSRLIEEILMQSKLESGTVSLKKGPVDLEVFLQDCLMPFEGVIKNKNLSVTLSLTSVTVNADYDQLDHSISNLISNAVRYAASSVSIECSASGIRIWNDCEPLGREDLTHIFDRFYTGKDSGHVQGGSTGIGLALAKEIIDLHGWHINARNENNGLSFIITF